MKVKTKILMVILSIIILAGGAAAIYMLTYTPAAKVVSTVAGSMDEKSPEIGNSQGAAGDASVEPLVVEEPAPIKSENLALKKIATADKHTQNYAAKNATDGSAKTYWEGGANTYPNILTVDTGKVNVIKTVRIRLNPDSIWAARQQTLTILGSEDGTTFKPVVDSAVYDFTPAKANTVTIDFDPVKTRFVQLQITANTGATGGQVAELEIY